MRIIGLVVHHYAYAYYKYNLLLLKYERTSLNR